MDRAGQETAAASHAAMTPQEQHAQVSPLNPLLKTLNPTSIFISHEVFLKLFCRSQLPHKFVNISFAITNIKNKLTDLWGSRLSKSNL